MTTDDWKQANAVASVYDDAIDVEAYETSPGTVAALAPVTASDALVRPAASVSDVAAAFRDYSALCDRLLDDSDIQHIGGKSFRKKSAWRKLAVAFGVSCEVRERIYERNDAGTIVRAEIVVRATAPNGRYMDGLGICDQSERKFSKPNHDVPATAMTRATNRACSDLFGMGEVSAEEVDTGAEPPAPEKWQTLGYASNGEYVSEVQAIVDALRKLTSDAQASYKQKRVAAGIGWPVAKSSLPIAWALVREVEEACATVPEPSTTGDGTEPF